MAWFQKFCRHTGLLIHDVIHAGETRRVVRRQSTQVKPDETVTLRRTTIDEIEFTARGRAQRSADTRGQ